MPKHAIRVDSLTVGRCFIRKPVGDNAPWDPEKPPPGAALADPDWVFRVDAVDEQRVTATSAAGDVVTLPLEDLVHEVPRAGWERLFRR